MRWLQCFDSNVGDEAPNPALDLTVGPVTALSSRGRLRASSRNGALRIALSWKQTGIEARPGNRSRGLHRWIEGNAVNLPAVIHAEYLGDFKIRLRFNDGVEGAVDFSDWLTGPAFEPLKDRTYSARFFIDGGTVVWPNGADIAPETLHERAKASAAA